MRVQQVHLLLRSTTWRIRTEPIRACSQPPSRYHLTSSRYHPPCVCPVTQVIKLDERQKIQERRTLERRQSMSERSHGSRHNSMSSSVDADERRGHSDTDERDRHRGQWARGMGTGCEVSGERAFPGMTPRSVSVVMVVGAS